MVRGIWPVTPRLLDDGRFLLTTSIGLPQKAFNIRRNPKVAMLFSEPTGSRMTEAGEERFKEMPLPRIAS